MAIGRVRAGGGAGYQRLFVRQTVLQRTFNLDTFVPDTEIDYPVLIPGHTFAPGAYHAAVTLSYNGKSLSHGAAFTVTKSQYTQVFKGAPALTNATHSGGGGSKLPWLVAGVAVILVFGAFAYRRWVYCW